MKTNLTFGKLLLVALTAAITGCGSSDKKEVDIKDTIVATTPETQEQPQEPKASTETFKDFDWNTVPSSTATIGAFPYISAPDGFYVQEKDGSSESKTGYSHFKDFNKLIMFNGQSFYNAEGKVATLKFQMKGEDTEWNQYKFDSSVDKYLSSIGAKLIGKIQITDAQKDFLNKDDDMAIYNHIVGDPYNDPVRCYALNHSKGKIMFQVFSNSASGEIAVVEMAAFEQTIKAPTAVEVK